MFRKLKKLYFKIYHLFKLIGIFIIALGFKSKVYAEECTNLIVNGQNWVKGNGNFILNNTNGMLYTTLDPLTDYTIFFDYGEKNFNEIINTETAITSFQVWHRWGSSYENMGTVDMTEKKYTFKTQANFNNNNLMYYFRMNGITGNTATTPFINNEEHEFWLVKGTNVCRTPPTPPGPQPNETYTNFISLYTNRMTYLAEGFTSNPYLIVMIGIIIAWVVLELALKLFNLRGGKRK